MADLKAETFIKHETKIELLNFKLITNPTIFYTRCYMMALNLKIMSKEIKCYCGHTKTCDCGKKVETALDWFNNELDDILELYPSEWDEIQKNVIIAKEIEKKQLIQFAKYILHENHEYKSYENIVSDFFKAVL